MIELTIFYAIHIFALIYLQNRMYQTVPQPDNITTDCYSKEIQMQAEMMRQVVNFCQFLPNLCLFAIAETLLGENWIVEVSLIVLCCKDILQFYRTGKFNSNVMFKLLARLGRLVKNAQ